MGKIIFITFIFISSFIHCHFKYITFASLTTTHKTFHKAGTSIVFVVRPGVYERVASVKRNCQNMALEPGTDDLDTLENPSGGLDSTSYREEFEELRKRMDKLSSKDRRKTMEQFSMIFPEIQDVRPKSPQQGMQRTLQQQQPVLQQQDFQAAQREGKITFETSNRRLKNFSALPKPASGELDYKHWRRAAVRVLEDDELPEVQRKRILLQSLVGSADDTIDPHRKLPALELLKVLDKVYGSTENGGDMLADFYQIYQGQNQAAGEYLNLLFVELSEVIAAGGLTMDKMSETLLGQFIRGTFDEDLLNKLRLEEKLEDPPSFPDLLASVRKEESKRTQRRLRHKKIVKSQMSTVECANSDSESVVKAETTGRSISIPNGRGNEVVQLQQRISQLETQVAQAGQGQGGVGRRKVFCYRCGQDGHVATVCNNVGNKVLVDQKVEERRKAYKRGN